MKSILQPIVFLILAMISLNVSAQNSEKVINLKKQKIQIHGTSTLHDWTCDVTESAIKVIADFDGAGVTTLKGATVNIPVKGIKSGKSAMDSNTYSALKMKSHPNIIFKLNAPTEGSTLKGTLTIAGTSNPVTLKADKKGNTFSGKYTFKMSEFGIEPPTAMFGTVKTGDEVTIEYSVDLDAGTEVQ
ncbi:YceI family protein [Limibacter armeniacum]|uniref:YceI family protein n=1 Tax=Limibacter armeniacum TaxID=466084 RepID=UPI002FE6BE02